MLKNQTYKKITSSHAFNYDQQLNLAKLIQASAIATGSTVEQETDRGQHMEKTWKHTHNHNHK